MEQPNPAVSLKLVSNTRLAGLGVISELPDRVKEQGLTRFGFHLPPIKAAEFSLRLLGCRRLFVVFLRGKNWCGQESPLLNALTAIKASNYFYWHSFLILCLCKHSHEHGEFCRD